MSASTINAVDDHCSTEDSDHFLKTLLQIIRNLRGVFYTTMVAFAFAVTNILIFITGETNHTFKVSLWNNIPLCILCLVTLAIKRPSVPNFCQREGVLLALSGFLNGFTSVLLTGAIISSNPADTVSVFFVVLPIMVTIFDAVINKVKIRCLCIPFTLMSIGGVILVVRPPLLFRGNTANNMNLMGILLALSSAICMSFGLLIVKRLEQLNTDHFFTVLSTTSNNVAISACLCLYFHVLTLPDNFNDSLLFIFTAAMFFIGYYLLYLAVGIERPTTVSVLLTLEVAFTFIMQYLITSLEFHWLSVVGGALVFTGCVGTTISRGKSPEEDDGVEEEPLIE